MFFRSFFAYREKKRKKEVAKSGQKKVKKLLKDCYLLPCGLVALPMPFVCTFYTRFAHPEQPRPIQTPFATSGQRPVNEQRMSERTKRTDPNDERTTNHQRTENEQQTDQRIPNKKIATPTYNHADCRMYTYFFLHL